ncbi:AraC-like DNA-binding protein [Mumia flava]|uniref:AraC-like DNA-binding protein n=1 Tax=Mumia flava TaxID=1348852 RepID=A0A2M9B8D0_9ACTN|nr:helix-turn-helix domain-containing protein [Mumia flava]PJJ54209.1 AraC-like DNA-binding protein [Mumia flava]
MRLFDSRTLPPAETLDRLHDAYESSLFPSRLEHIDTDAPGGLVTTLDLYPMGACAVAATESTGFHLTRNRQSIARNRGAALSVPIVSGGELDYLGRRTVVGPRDLSVIDSEQLQSFRQPSHGTGTLFQVPRELLDLPQQVIIDGAGNLERSPLYRTAQRFFAALFRDAERISADPLAAEAAQRAGVDLLRALLISAAPPRRDVKDRFADTFVTRALALAHDDLRDPSLSLDSLAARMNVSRRYAYARFAEAGVSFEQWVIERRLRRVAGTLSSRRFARVPIGSVAHAWGFRSVSHFQRRFRETYGASPAQWRLRALGEQGDG